MLTRKKIFKWKLGEEELKYQVENYNTLSVLKSSRKIAALLIGFSASITFAFQISNPGNLSIFVILISTALTFLLAYLIYKGYRNAIIIAMLWWTAEKGFQLMSGHPQAIFWWLIYILAFWQAYQVEEFRNKKIF